MMRLLLTVCLLSSLAPATTLRLRYGGVGSTYRVTAISMASPAVITVQHMYTADSGHALSNGDTIYIHSIPGCQEANGFHTVASADQAGGTITAGFTCTGQFASGYQAGWLGKVQNVTLNPQPRMFLPPAGDPIRTRMTDAGGGSPAATENGPAFQGLVSRYASWLSVSCDGVTDAACPTELAHISYGDVITGADIFGLASVWRADNSKTTYLAAAKYYLNNVHRLLWDPLWVNSAARTRTENFPCDIQRKRCGGGSDTSDQISQSLSWTMMAYDVIADQLTAGQKTAFANKILNGYLGTGCTNSLVDQSGSATLSSGSANVTGTGLSAYAANDYLYFRTAAYPTGGYFAQVQSVADDGHLTLTTTSSVSASGVTHAKVNAWGSTSCGALHIMSADEQGTPVLDVVRRGITTLSAPVAPGDNAITVTSVADLLDAPPYYLLVGNYPGEVMKVTAASGTTLSVTRAQFGTSASSFSQGAVVAWSRQPGNFNTYVPYIGPEAITGMWRSNLHQPKAVAYIAAGIALADVDSRAVALAETAWNYYYDLVYPYNKDYWSGPTPGGATQGYALGRFPATSLPVGLAGENAFSTAIHIFEPYYWRPLLLPLYWSHPGTWIRGPWPTELTSAIDDWYVRYYPFLAVAQYFDSSDPVAAWANYWYRSLANFHVLGSYNNSTAGRVAPFALAYMRGTDTSTNFRSAGQANPWKAMTETDFDLIPNSSFGAVTSRTDWTDSATWVYAILGYHDVADHNADYPVYPGDYLISKGRQVLLGDNSGSVSGQPATNMNYFEVGGGPGVFNDASYPAWFSGHPGQRNVVDKTGGTATYFHARGNFVASYQSSAVVTRAQRHLVHLKGSPEYVVMFDNFATSTAKQFRTWLHYWRCGSSCTPNETYTPTRSGTDITYARGSAKILTKLLFPDGSSPTMSDGTPGTWGTAETIDWGPSGTAAQMIAVHRVSSNLTDTMPAVALLGTVDANHVGFQIDDGDNSRAVVWSKAGDDQSSASFVTTFAGVGQCLVTGLPAGTYNVTRNGASLASNQAVGANDGALAFTCTGASPVSYAVTQSGVAVAPTITSTSPLPDGVVGSAYSQVLTATGDPTIIWTSSDLPAWATLDSNGLLHGTPNVAATVTIHVTATNSAGSDSKTLPITTVSVAVPVAPTITTVSLPGGTVNKAYSQTLAATGDTPITWSVLSGSLPSGLTLNATTGAIAGTPNAATTASFTIRATNAAGTADRALSITILAPVPRVRGRKITAVNLQKVVAPPTITSTSPLPGGTAGSPYSQTLTATGDPTITWTSADLPAWATLDASGLLHGTPNVAATVTIHVTATNSAGSDSKALSLTTAATNYLVSPTDLSQSPWSPRTLTVSGLVATATGSDSMINQQITGLDNSKVYFLSGNLQGNGSFSPILYTSGGYPSEANFDYGAKQTLALTTSIQAVSSHAMPTSGQLTFGVGGWSSWATGQVITFSALRVNEGVPSGSELATANSDFSQAAWTKSNATVGGDNITLTSTGDASVSQDITVERGSAYQFKFEMRTDTGTSLRIDMEDVANAYWVYITANPSTTWTTYTVNTAITGGTTLRIHIGSHNTFTAGETVQVRNVSVKKLTAP